MVAVPVDSMPADLMRLMRAPEAKVRSLAGHEINLYDYVKEHVDEIIFTPFMLEVDPSSGVIHRELSGMVVHDYISKPLEQMDLRNDPYRLGKRVIYINPARLKVGENFVGSGKEKVRWTDPRLKPAIVDPVNLMQAVIEDTAHRETMQLVQNGSIDSKYYD